MRKIGQPNQKSTDGLSSLSNTSPCLEIFWGNIKKRKGQGCSDAIAWYADAWYKANPQNMPKDSKEYKVRRTLLHACMPFVYQSVLPFVYQPMLTHSVCASCECVCGALWQQAWYKANPQNMPKDIKEYKVRRTLLDACMPFVYQLVLPFVYQPMLTHASVCASCECVCGCGRRGTSRSLPLSCRASPRKAKSTRYGAHAIACSACLRWGNKGNIWFWHHWLPSLPLGHHTTATPAYARVHSRSEGGARGGILRILSKFQCIDGRGHAWAGINKK
jgi:hypothetical protein